MIEQNGGVAYILMSYQQMSALCSSPARPCDNTQSIITAGGHGGHGDRSITSLWYMWVWLIVHRSEPNKIAIGTHIYMISSMCKCARVIRDETIGPFFRDRNERDWVVVLEKKTNSQILLSFRPTDPFHSFHHNRSLVLWLPRLCAYFFLTRSKIPACPECVNLWALARNIHVLHVSTCGCSWT